MNRRGTPERSGILAPVALVFITLYDAEERFDPQGIDRPVGGW
jgi:hypothetical protein